MLIHFLNELLYIYISNDWHLIKYLGLKGLNQLRIVFELSNSSCRGKYIVGFEKDVKFQETPYWRNLKLICQQAWAFITEKGL